MGVVLVVLSTGGGSSSAEPPRIGDHWHEAYGVYVCDGYLPPFPDNMRTAGLHTHADGLIHVEPRSTRDTGTNATVGRFAEGVDMNVSQDQLVLPDGTRYQDGDECDGQPADVRILRNGEAIATNPDDIRLTEGGTVAVVFAPAGDEVPPVPSMSQLATPNAGETPPPGAPSTASTAPPP